jgi:hypothetical protein
LNQGIQYTKYKTKNANKNKRNLEQSILKEGFDTITPTNSLTTKSNTIINDNDYTSQQSAIAALTTSYTSSLTDYKKLTSQIADTVNNYYNRVDNSNNQYHNKNVSFKDEKMAYVTNQGVIKPYASIDIYTNTAGKNGCPIDTTYIDISWNPTYTTGTYIPTTPSLKVGTAMISGQSCGNEGSNVFSNGFLSNAKPPTYMGCFNSSPTNNDMTFIGGSPSSTLPTIAPIQNGNFSQPVVTNDVEITDGTTVPGWYFGRARLLSNLGNWDIYASPPAFTSSTSSSNQCVLLTNQAYMYTTLELLPNINYQLSFSTYGRDCCTGPKTNPIKVALYDSSTNTYISTIIDVTPIINSWNTSSVTFTVSTQKNYHLYFSGTGNTNDQSSAITNISLTGTVLPSGTYSYDQCMNSAIASGYQYFALQNVDTVKSTGYCAVSKTSTLNSSAVNCSPIADGKNGGGLLSNAIYDIGATAVPSNIGKLGYIDEDSNLYTYPVDNRSYTNTFKQFDNTNVLGSDITGKSFSEATVDSCKEYCGNNNDCAGFVFNTDTSFCYPKTNKMVGNIVSTSNNSTVYLRDSAPKNLPTGVSNEIGNIDSVYFQNYNSKGAIGSSYGLATETNAQEQKLGVLQTTMGSLSGQLAGLTNKYQLGASSADKQSLNNATGMEQYLTDLTNNKEQTTGLNDSGNSQNILNDSDIMVLQKNYEYLCWSILAIGILLIAINVINH